MTKIILFLILLPYQLFSVTITGNIAPNSSVKCISYLDYISNQSIVLAETISDNDGNFEFNFIVDKPNQVELSYNDYSGKIFLENQGHYIVNDSTIKGKKKIILLLEIDSDINEIVNEMELEAAKEGYHLAMNEDNYFVINSKIEQMLKRFSMHKNSFIQEIGFYIVANIELNLFLKQKNENPLENLDEFLNKWFFSRQILWNNPYYWGTFSYALDSRCNINSYFNKLSLQCTPSNFEEIQSTLSSFKENIFKKMATLEYISRIAKTDRNKAAYIIAKYPNDYFQNQLKIISDRIISE